VRARGGRPAAHSSSIATTAASGIAGSELKY
jgi:hypothetical protein